MRNELAPVLPFVWPDPRVSAGLASYAVSPPYDLVTDGALTIFGVISAIDAQGVRWLRRLLDDQADLKLLIVVSVWPACKTTHEDLLALAELGREAPGRVGLKIRPELNLMDRASNLLCVARVDGTMTVLH